MCLFAVGAFQSRVAGSFHTCARTAAGALRCFGLNQYGQLGDGTLRTSLRPVDVDLKGVAQVVAGGFHTCARLADGTVRCWGQELPIDYAPIAPPPALSPIPLPSPDGGRPHYPDGGPVLQAFELPAVPRPREVRSLRGAVEIGVGSEHVCGRMPDGAVLCAGSNGLSQLGRETTFRGRPQAFEPVDGLAGADVAALSVRESQGCVLLRDTRVRCWGYDNYGSLGVGSTDTVKRATEVVAR